MKPTIIDDDSFWKYMYVVFENLAKIDLSPIVSEITCWHKLVIVKPGSVFTEDVLILDVDLGLPTLFHFEEQIVIYYHFQRSNCLCVDGLQIKSQSKPSTDIVEFPDLYWFSIGRTGEA